MKTLALIPARGGSKGIPRKNIKELAGKPLIAWTIEAAKAAKLVHDVIVSTDDDEIADVAQRWGARIPFMRPAELARDDTPGIDPVFHAISLLPEYEAIVLLQPTSPMRTAEDIDACIGMARDLGAPAAVAVTEPEKHPFWMYRIGPNRRLAPLFDGGFVPRRQELPPVFALNGAIYFSQVEWLQRNRMFVTPETVGYVMPPDRSVDIDTLLDWKFAELLLRERA